MRTQVDVEQPAFALTQRT